RLPDVVRRALRIRVRMEEGGEAVLLVRLEHGRAGRRKPPEDRERRDDGYAEEQRQMQPPRPRDEEDRAERKQIHERRPEVRLEEDQSDRHSGEADSREHRPQLAHAPSPVGEEGREEEDEEQLSELGRLEAEEREVDPALRPA